MQAYPNASRVAFHANALIVYIRRIEYSTLITGRQQRVCTVISSTRLLTSGVAILQQKAARVDEE
jgi:hypothetical protein